jgi:hypothetical protein
MTLQRTLASGLVLLAGVAAFVLPTAPASAVSTNVVISEFRTRGPGGGDDEFVEIMNISGDSISLGGYLLEGSGHTTSDPLEIRAVVPEGVVLAPGQHYLFANAATPLGVAFPADQFYAPAGGINDEGSVAISRPDYQRVDTVGIGVTLWGEGTRLAPQTDGSHSYQRERSGYQDTDNNAADFALSTTPAPENLASPPTPDPGATTTTTTDIGPPAEVPEVPFGGLLPLLAAAMVGIGYVRLRRRALAA